ncbi:MAG: histidinol-phosphate aminotransferase family protein [Spirochaetes bacterium]|nr:histidinol-phosphate aminotransferase family protein [Spirochaetota bacterium]
MKKENYFFRKNLINKNENFIDVKENLINLSLNESPFNPFLLLKHEDLKEIVNFSINIYPRKELENSLKEKICKYNNEFLTKNETDLKEIINPSNIILGNGIDELLYILFMSINDYKSKILISIPTYPDYKNYALSVGLNVLEIPLIENFQLNVSKIIKESKNKEVKLIIICNPNNPTGNLINSADIYYLLENIKDKLILIDEAYFEFSKVTFLKHVNLYPNLIIARSFSKGFFAPGLRLGYFVSSVLNIKELNKVKGVYNLSNLTQFIGIKFLENLEKFEQRIEYICKLRDFIFNRLQAIKNIEPYPSSTNFILFKCKFDSTKLYEYLLKKEISLRNVSKLYNLYNCLRVSIGTKENMDFFIKNILEFNEQS